MTPAARMRTGAKHIIQTIELPDGHTIGVGTTGDGSGGNLVVLRLGVYEIVPGGFQPTALLTREQAGELASGLLAAAKRVQVWEEAK